MLKAIKMTAEGNGTKTGLCIIGRAGNVTESDLMRVADLIRAGAFRVHEAQSGAPWIYGRTRDGLMFEADEEKGLTVTYGEGDRVLAIEGDIYADRA